MAADVRSVTDSNLRSIQLNTGVHVTPGQTLVSSIKKNVLQEVPVGEEWKVPLIHSLLEIRSGEFKLEFDEDDFADNEIVDDVLLHVCTSCTFFFLHARYIYTRGVEERKKLNFIYFNHKPLVINVLII